MANNKSFFEELFDIYILYKLRWVILILIILFGVIFFAVKTDLDKEYREYGYTGFSDNIKYDEWTGETIRKEEISTYSSNNKFITNSKGEQITVAKIQEQLDQYNSIQGNKAFIAEERKDSLDNICKILLNNYLDIDYEIKQLDLNSSANFYEFNVIGEYENIYNSNFSSYPSLQSFIREVFKDKYAKQNNL